MNAANILKTSIAINMILGGLVLAGGSHPATVTIANLFFDIMHWPLDAMPMIDNKAAHFATALAGGGFFGWGIASWIVATKLLPRDPPLAKSIITRGTVAWFLVDSLGSIMAGAPLNAILNAAILASLLLPLRAIPDNT
jgi:hypothetical protein